MKTVSILIGCLAGWLILSWLISRSAGWLVSRYGLPISPAILFWTAIAAFVVIAPWEYARVWRGYLYPIIAQRPALSLSKDIAKIS